MNLLLAAALLGTATMAVSLLGLARWPVLWPMGLAALPVCYRTGRGWAREWKAPPPWMWLAFVPPAIMAVLALFPDRQVDALTYHLGIPSEILKRGKAVWDGSQCAMGCPLLIEHLYLYAVGLGWAPLAHFIQLSLFAAALVIYCGMSQTGWIATAAILCTSSVLMSIPVAKNDLAAASFIIVGAVMLSEGKMALSAVLFGFGATAKNPAEICATVAAIWVAIQYPRHLVRWLGIAGLCASGMILRAWLWTGNPIWPANSLHWPVGLWDQYDELSTRGLKVALDWWPDMTTALRDGAPVILCGWMFMWWVPYRPALKWYALASIAAVTILIPGAWFRMSMPGIVLLTGYVVFGASWRGIPFPYTKALGCVLALGMVPAWTVWHHAEGTANLLHDAAVMMRGGNPLTTLAVAQEELRGTAGNATIFADIRIYGIPMKVWCTRNYQRSAAWEACREHRTSQGVRKWFRQRNITTVLYNPMTAGFLHDADRAYEWDEKAVPVWRDFVDRYMDLTWMGQEIDSLNGGWVIYHVRGEPKAPPKWLPYLPGAETLWPVFTTQRTAEDFTGALKMLDRMLPNVDWIRNRLGWAAMQRRDFDDAWKWLMPGLVHGTLDDSSIEDGMYATAQKQPKVCRQLARALMRIKPERTAQAMAMLERLDAQEAKP